MRSTLVLIAHHINTLIYQEFSPTRTSLKLTYKIKLMDARPALMQLAKVTVFERVELLFARIDFSIKQ